MAKVTSKSGQLIMTVSGFVVLLHMGSMLMPVAHGVTKSYKDSWGSRSQLVAMLVPEVYVTARATPI